MGKTTISLLLYLLAGYWLLGDWKSLLMITFILVFHEAGHFIAMRIVGYRDLGVFFLPLLGAYVSGSKRVVTQRESAFVLLAGPLPGMLLGALLYILLKNDIIPSYGAFDIPLERLMLFLITLNGINLLPVYPLDGGQLLNRVFLEEDGLISKLFVVVSAILLGYLAVHYGIYPLLILPAGLLFRLWRDAGAARIEKRITATNIDTEIDYEDLSDQHYWQIRQILIEEDPSIRRLAEDHFHDYAPAESQIQQAVEGQLHRTLIQDLSIAAKVLILLIWIGSLATPLWVWQR
jgi:Zn-dependent protease